MGHLVKMNKDGKVFTVDSDQIEIMKSAGWEEGLPKEPESKPMHTKSSKPAQPAAKPAVKPAQKTTSK